MNFNLKTAIGTLAPTLAGMLGGPLAGTAVTALEGAFGLTPGAGVDAVTQVVQTGMTPDAIAAVRLADQTHAEKLKSLDIDLVRLNADHDAAVEATDAGDRDSARKREMAVRDQTPARLAYMIIGGFFGIAIAQLVALMGWPDLAVKIPPQGWVIIGNISGYLAGEAKAAASYFFGTTQDSGKKTDLLAQSTPA